MLQWPQRGRPENPAGWLCIVARNAAVDLLRAQARHRGREPAPTDAEIKIEFNDDDASDLNDQAQILLLCCNPRLSANAQIALALKALGGFKVGEISRLLYMTPESAKRMLSRARRLAAKDPTLLRRADGASDDRRYDTALQTIYALFTEGYAASAGEAQLRSELALEAIRLADLLLASARLPGAHRGNLQALLALMLLQMARFPARVSASGEPVRLQDQDRALWDLSMLRAGFAALAASSKAEQPDAYHLEARIAAEHAAAGKFADTNWHKILELYDQLLTIKDTLGVRLARCVAVRYVHGPQAALLALRELAPDERRGGRSWRFVHEALRADFLAAAGEARGARSAWQAAARHAPTSGDQRFVSARLQALTDQKRKSD